MITDFSAPELDVYARLSEAALAHLYEPAEGIFIAESPKVVERALNAGYEPLSMLVEEKHIEGEARELISRVGDIPIYTAAFDVLTKLGSMAAVKDAGLLRSEGKDYVVKDGDIVLFRFNV